MEGVVKMKYYIYLNGGVNSITTTKEQALKIIEKLLFYMDFKNNKKWIIEIKRK